MRSLPENSSGKERKERLKAERREKCGRQSGNGVVSFFSVARDENRFSCARATRGIFDDRHQSEAFL